MSTDIASGVTPDLETRIADLQAKVDQIYSWLVSPKEPERTRYSIEEAAKLVGKSEFTVRQWANLGRINAEKCADRRGASALWRISAAEIRRYQEEGLLPLNPSRNASE